MVEHFITRILIFLFAISCCVVTSEFARLYNCYRKLEPYRLKTNAKYHFILAIAFIITIIFTGFEA